MLYCLLQRRAFIFTLALLYSTLPLVTALVGDRYACQAALLQANLSAPQITVNPANSSDILTVRLRECKEICGGDIGFYPYAKIHNILFTWIWSILLLAGNMHLAPLGVKYKILTLLHLLGDPIDSMWSLLTKLEACHRSRAWVRRVVEPAACSIDDIATVLVAIEELDDSNTDPEMPTKRIQKLISLGEASEAACKEAARELRECQVDESFRTYLAILTYVYTVSTAFINANRDHDNHDPPANRIGLALLFAWMLPAVILSAATGRFSSENSCRQCIDRLRMNLASATAMPAVQRQDTLNDDPIEPAPIEPLIGENPQTSPEMFSENRQSSMGGCLTSKDASRDAQPWDGAIYSYRPQKSLFLNGAEGCQPSILLAIAATPVFFSVLSAVYIAWTTTTGAGIGCRTVAELSIGLSWFVSIFITWATFKSRLCTGKYHFWLILAKDVAITCIVLLLVFLISIGVFQSCSCWSTEIYQGSDNAWIDLDILSRVRYLDRTEYPVVVAVNILLLLLLKVFMMWKGWNRNI